MLDVAPGAMWLPGTGVTGTDERAAAKAIEEYDTDLLLGQNQETGDWMVFSRRANEYNDGQPFPVMNLGKQLPGADTIQRKLYEGDIKRHGRKIFEQLQRRNDSIAESARKENDAKLDVAADAMRWAHDKMTGTTRRIFVPGRSE